MSLLDPSAAARPDSGLFGLDDELAAARVVVLPLPFDATTSYHAGTARGPQAILRASHQIDLFDVDTGRPYLAGIHMLPIPPSVQAWNATARQAAEQLAATWADGGMADAAPSIDAPSDGDDRFVLHGPGNSLAERQREQLDRVNEASHALEHYVRTRTRELLAQDKLVCVLGGDHSVPLGSIVEHAARYPALGILHIDAHADLRPAYQGFVQSHASIMHNVLLRVPRLQKLVQVGLRDLCDEEMTAITDAKGQIRAFFDSDLAAQKHRGVPWQAICDQIIDELPSQVYVSLDIDGLDPSLCPHTGTPVPGGLQFAELVTLLSRLVASGRTIVGFDLTEVAPAPTEAGGDWDANVGARVLYKLIGFALRSHATPPARSVPRAKSAAPRPTKRRVSPKPKAADKSRSR